MSKRMSDDSERCWFYIDSEFKIRGPITEAELSDCLVQSIITDSSFVSQCHDRTQWTRACKVPGLLPRLRLKSIGFSTRSSGHSRGRSEVIKEESFTDQIMTSVITAAAAVECKSDNIESGMVFINDEELHNCLDSDTDTEHSTVSEYDTADEKEEKCSMPPPFSKSVMDSPTSQIAMMKSVLSLSKLLVSSKSGGSIFVSRVSEGSLCLADDECDDSDSDSNTYVSDDIDFDDDIKEVCCISDEKMNDLEITKTVSHIMITEEESWQLSCDSDDDGFTLTPSIKKRKIWSTPASDEIMAGFTSSMWDVVSDTKYGSTKKLMKSATAVDTTADEDDSVDSLMPSIKWQRTLTAASVLSSESSAIPEDFFAMMDTEIDNDIGFTMDIHADLDDGRSVECVECKPTVSFSKDTVTEEESSVVDVGIKKDDSEMMTMMMPTTTKKESISIVDELADDLSECLPEMSTILQNKVSSTSDSSIFSLDCLGLGSRKKSVPGLRPYHVRYMRH